MAQARWVRVFPNHFHADPWYRALPDGWHQLVYRSLLIEQAGQPDGVLPADPRALALILRVDNSDFAPIWERISEKFPQHPNGGVANPRMMREWERSKAISESASKSGKASVAARRAAAAKRKD